MHFMKILTVYTLNSHLLTLKGHNHKKLYVFCRPLKYLKPYTGFYTKLNVWGSLGLNFDMTGVPSLKMGVPSFYIWTFHEGIQTGLGCQTGVAKHQVIFRNSTTTVNHS